MFLLKATLLAGIAFTTHAGKYEGTGAWSGRGGMTGTFTVKSAVAVTRDDAGGVRSIRVASDYLINGMPMGDAFVIDGETNGFFKLLGDDGHARGDGYCLGPKCHVSMPADALEESVVFGDDNCIERFGSKIEAGNPWSWSERLCPVARRAPAKVRLDCKDLGDGGLVRVQVVEGGEGGGAMLAVAETDEAGVVTTTPLPAEAFTSHRIPLSAYYDYARTLVRNADGTWSVEWSCGEAFPASCVEAR